MTEEIAYLREWVGRTETATDCLTASLMARFDATLDIPEVERHPTRASTMIHWCLGAAAWPVSALALDGHPPKGDFLPPVSLPRRMWAAGALRFFGDLNVGEKITRSSTIRDVVLKQGRSGPLCFVTIDHRLTGATGVLIEERQDIVFRSVEPAAKIESVRTEPAQKATWTRKVMVTPPLLFRYSALTFNSHRIHYDLPYACSVEGYPGLVVHGPLQATQLMHFAQEIRGERPTNFAFRSRTPLFDTEDYELCAVEEEGGLRLWTGRSGGSIAMEAQASW